MISKRWMIVLIALFVAFLMPATQSVAASVTLTLTAPTDTSVSQGDSLGPFTASITNNSGSRATFYVYAYVWAPDGSCTSVVSGKMISLRPYKTISKSDLYYSVSSTAQTGTYSYYMAAYDTSYNLIDDGYFWFEVASSLTSGLVAYYPFNGNANDESGNGNNGTVYVATLTTDRNGNANSAYSFTSSSKIYDTVGSELSVSNVTLAAWIKITGSGDYNPRIIGVGAPGSSAQYYSLILDGTSSSRRICFYNYKGGTYSHQAYSTTYLATDSTWHHVAATFDGSQIKIFIDGQLDSTTGYTTALLSFSSALLQIGYSDNNLDHFIGSIDDVRIYNRALSDSEIQELYSGNSSTTVLVLTRNASSLDSEETKVTDFLTQNGYQYELADSSTITGLNVSSYKVIYFRTGSEPTGYNSTSVLTPIQNAVEGGSSLIVEYYGNYLAKYLGWGSITSGGWYPAVYDKLAYVKSITSHEIFNGISTWAPPTEPDKDEQLIWSLTKTGSYTCKDLSLTSAQNIEYWELWMTYGWNGQSTNSSYCQSWGGCTSDRSVRSNSIRYATHGSGKVIHPYGAGIGSSNCNDSRTLGQAGTSLMKSLINWAGK